MPSLLRNPTALAQRQVDLKAWAKQFWFDTGYNFECALEGGFREDCEEKAKKPSNPIVPADTKQTSFKKTPLVTGCGRSGTLSVSDFLNSINIASVHESVVPDAVSVSWLYAYETSIYPFEGLKNAKYRRDLKRRHNIQNNLDLFDPVVQIVRHPLKVISSTRRCFCGRGTRTLKRGMLSDKKSWAFVDKLLVDEYPQLKSLSLDSIERSMIYWYAWNKHITETLKPTQILDLTTLSPSALVTGLGLDSQTDMASLPTKMSPPSKHHVSPEEEKEKLPDVTFQDLLNTNEQLARDIQYLAKMYGYPLLE